MLFRAAVAMALLAVAAGLAEESKQSDVERLRDTVGFRDPKQWFRIGITRSVVTETRRRIYFNKHAVTQALLTHGGGREWKAAPMDYPNATVFVAEGIDGSGRVHDTEVMILRDNKPPKFLLFDAEGKASLIFRQPRDRPGEKRSENVPKVCIRCHMGRGYFHPMMSFPKEPKKRAVLIDKRYRDAEIVTRFLEGYHRGERLFGPYGAIWLSKLKADAKAGMLAKEDEPFYRKLRKRYPDLLGRE